MLDTWPVLGNGSPAFPIHSLPESKAMPKFILLEGIIKDVNKGNKFFTTYTEGEDQTKLMDGTVAYKVIGHAETVAEAQVKLYGRTYP